MVGKLSTDARYNRSFRDSQILLRVSQREWKSHSLRWPPTDWTNPSRTKRKEVLSLWSSVLLYRDFLGSCGCCCSSWLPCLFKLASFLITLVCRVSLALFSVIAMQTSFHTTSWYTYNSLREYMATEIRLKTCYGLNINSAYASPGCERNKSPGERTRYLVIHSFFGCIWQSRNGKAATQCCESLSKPSQNRLSSLESRRLHVF